MASGNEKGKSGVEAHLIPCRLNPRGRGSDGEGDEVFGALKDCFDRMSDDVAVSSRSKRGSATAMTFTSNSIHTAYCHLVDFANPELTPSSPLKSRELSTP